MNSIAAYKGIQPGKIISHKLASKGYTQRRLAELIGEHYQTLNAIIAGRRCMTIEQSLKIDKALGFEEGFFAIIQTYYQIGLSSGKAPNSKGFPIVRRSVFWDVDPETLDWTKDKDFIIGRVTERGSEQEIRQVYDYYGIQR